MLTISENIKTIEELVQQNTPASLTYASLECRLTIEQLCYERLRIAHDYISHDDLSKWQPRDIVKTLIQDVDPYITEDMTFSISKNSVDNDKNKIPEEIYYQELGKQIGFNANLMGKLWNALANLALHISVPKSKNDNISRYGDTGKIRAKIEECLIEFRKISKTTLVVSGFGSEVSFDCIGCDAVNKRKTDTLQNDKRINCINPDCIEKYEVKSVDGEFQFHRCRVKLKCTCENDLLISENAVMRMKPATEGLRIVCSNCEEAFLISWRLYQAVDPEKT